MGALASAAESVRVLREDARALRRSGACIGLMLRHEWVEQVQALEAPAFDFIELYPENYLHRTPRLRAELEGLAARFPLTAHCVHGSYPGVDPLDEAYLDEVRAFCDALRIHWVSDHIGVSRHRGQVLHEILPVPLNAEVAAHLAVRATAGQARLGRPLLLENTCDYWHASEASDLTEARFLSALFAETEARWLLDVNNLFVNHLNGVNPGMPDLDELPLHAVRHLHIGGFSVDSATGIVVDSHGTKPAAPVLKLLEEVIARIGEVPVVFEWERSFGSFGAVHQVIAELRQHVDAGLARFHATRERAA